MLFRKPKNEGKIFIKQNKKYIKALFSVETNSDLPIMNSCARSIWRLDFGLFHHSNKSLPFHCFSKIPVLVYFNWKQNEIFPPKSRFQNVSPGPSGELLYKMSNPHTFYHTAMSEHKPSVSSRAARYLNIPQSHYAPETRCFHLYLRHMRQSPPINLIN